MSEGGLAQALVESCLRHGVGATVSLLGDPFVGLFSESAARAIVTVPPDRLEAFLTMAASLGVPAGEIGRTGGSALVVDRPLRDPARRARRRLARHPARRPRRLTLRARRPGFTM